MENGKHADGKISFVFIPGIRVTCTLTRAEDGAYNGPCIGEDGSEAKMSMVPPKE